MGKFPEPDEEVVRHKLAWCSGQEDFSVDINSRECELLLKMLRRRERKGRVTGGKPRKTTQK